MILKSSKFSSLATKSTMLVKIASGRSRARSSGQDHLIRSREPKKDLSPWAFLTMASMTQREIIRLLCEIILASGTKSLSF